MGGKTYLTVEPRQRKQLHSMVRDLPNRVVELDARGISTRGVCTVPLCCCAFGFVNVPERVTLKFSVKMSGLSV